MNTELFNSGWSFALMPIGEKPKEKDFKPVDIPHDWLIQDTANLYADGDGYYIKRFTLENTEGKFYILRFDGVYMDSEVFLNGEKLFEWKYGYTTFDVELNGVKDGENELMVIVHHKSPNTRWYSGAGIFRNIRMTESGEDRIIPDGTYFCADQDGDSWAVGIDTEVTGSGEATIRHTLSDREGHIVRTVEKSCTLKPEVTRINHKFWAENIRCWDIDDPYLYTLKTEIIKNGESVYERVERVGFKTVKFTTDDGLFLNGRHIKINGACMHHDMGALGSAVNKAAIRRQLTIMKGMGVNSIRTSHNPPAPELMDLADEMGIMIDSEAFDMWELKKTDYDYARFFPEWHERDVRSWIRRDRNHVSVIMWSIGNEIYDTHGSPRGVAVTKELVRCVRIDDYNVKHPVTIGSNYMQWEGAQNCAEHIDTVGYNYTERLYNDHHTKHPDWIIYGSETASTIQSRGVYHFPVSKLTTTHDDHQCSSLLNCATGWGAVNCEYNITQDRNHKFSLGQYIWTAFDYIGEPTPYWTKNSYFGHIDTAGFPKDSYYAYRAEWLGDKAEPFVHLFPYWDFNEGQLIDVFIFSNCAKSELFVNGVSKGVYIHNHTDGDRLTGRWQVPYEKGEIMAIGYDCKGNELCRETRHSFGDAAKICLVPDKTQLKADGEDMIFVEISTHDKDGYPVENDRSRMNITVSGAGRLVGLDNGDSTDYEQYKGTSRKLFSGRLLAMIAAKDHPGEITVTVTSPGLPQESITLKAVPAPKRRGVCCNFENAQSPVSYEIPVRKLSLKVSTQKLTPQSGECYAEVRMFPENTTYTAGDIQFKAMTDAGVETNIVKIEGLGLKARLIPCGDGAYRLRAYCKNGGKYEEIISELEMENQGFGQAGFEAFGGWIAAALYSGSSHQLQDVFEGGVQTPWGDSYIEFSNISFGDVGSDFVRVGIYLNGYEEIPFEITDDSGEVYGSYVYYKRPIWNRYQYMDCKLDKKLTGVKNIRIHFHREIRFKGFEFLPITRAGNTISALDNNGIYGDTFDLCDDHIAEIGNNVTIEFNGFDFGDGGVTAVEIKGRSHNPNDTIHLRFAAENGADNQIVEFPGSDEVVTRRFEISKVTGKADVKLVFLPGCKFDLYSIKFE